MVSDNVARVQNLSLNFGEAVTHLTQSHERLLAEVDRLRCELADASNACQEYEGENQSLRYELDCINREARELRRQLASVQGGLPG